MRASSAPPLPLPLSLSNRILLWMVPLLVDFLRALSPSFHPHSFGSLRCQVLRHCAVGSDPDTSLDAIVRTVVVSSDDSFILSPFFATTNAYIGTSRVSRWITNWKRSASRRLNNDANCSDVVSKGMVAYRTNHSLFIHARTVDLKGFSHCRHWPGTPSRLRCNEAGRGSRWRGLQNFRQSCARYAQR